MMNRRIAIIRFDLGNKKGSEWYVQGYKKFFRLSYSMEMAGQAD